MKVVPAVNVITVPDLSLVLHVPGQEIPEPVTVPEPLPATAALTVYLGTVGGTYPAVVVVVVVVVVGVVVVPVVGLVPPVGFVPGDVVPGLDLAGAEHETAREPLKQPE